MLTINIYRTFFLIGLLLSVSQLHAQSLTSQSLQLPTSLETTPAEIASSSTVYDSTALDSLLINPRTATSYSVFGTLFPAALGFGLISNSSGSNGMGPLGGMSLGFGLLVGPSMGHFYADNNKKGVNGLLVRLLGTGITAIGISQFEICLGTCGGSSDGNNGGAALLMLAGTGLYVGNTIVQWVTADNSAMEYNDQVRSNYKIGLAPYLDPTTNAKGLTMRVEF